MDVSIRAYLISFPVKYVIQVPVFCLTQLCAGESVGYTAEVALHEHRAFLYVDRHHQHSFHVCDNDLNCCQQHMNVSVPTAPPTK